KELTFILNTFSEVATGHADELHIKTISSSDLLVYVTTYPFHAACLATAIERLVALNKSLLEIRKLQVDLRRQGVPDGAVKGIEEHANTHMEKGIDKLSVEIVGEFYNRNDDGRKNELTTAVKFSLNNIANRIDQGYNIEVRCAPLAEEKPENEEVKKALAVVQKASANMQFLKLEGDPILKLPESKKGKETTKSDDKEAGKSKCKTSAARTKSEPMPAD